MNVKVSVSDETLTDKEKLLDDTARILVLGDAGVGKSSLITAATESFDSKPPPCLPPTRLPPSADNIPLLVIDTSLRSETNQTLESLFENADVILLCYAIDMPESIEHLRTYWLPEIKKLNENIPIVLCGCKLDLAPDKYLFDTQRLQLNEILQEFRQVETAIECSARTLNYVQEVFHFALKAVCHPQYPLYDTLKQQIKIRCAQALKRIFLICDHDGDGKLNEKELNAFQILCFNSPLSKEELLNIMTTVKEIVYDGVIDNSLTINGFLYLNVNFMERGVYETVWTILRKFGYTNELTLSDDILKDIYFDHAPDQILQLSEQGIHFLKQWFTKIDINNSNSVREKDIVEIMKETTPEPIWTESFWNEVLISSTHAGHLTCEGFLAKWRYSMLINPKSTLKQLLYLGWKNESIPDACTLSKRRKQERSENIARSILQCWVFGSIKSGKTSFLKGLVNCININNMEDEIYIKTKYIDNDNNHDYIAIATLPTTFGEKTLVLYEIGAHQIDSLLKNSKNKADIAVFLYSSNDSKSFIEAQNLMLTVSETVGDILPCVLIQTKSDLPVTTDIKSGSERVINELKLRDPIKVSIKTGELNSVYKCLIQIALKPGFYDIPETPTRKAAKIRRLWTKRVLLASSIGIGAGMLFLYIYPVLSSKEKLNLKKIDKTN